MGMRQYPECGGELVLAFRPSDLGRFKAGGASVVISNGEWRCSTCGQSFTAEQLRTKKKPKQSNQPDRDQLPYS
jgi:DNA-directed RNA polymerase subunit RPC12/RpoP